jgi:hypothetical protein
MKKALLFFALCSAVCTNGHAQTKWSVNGGLVTTNNYVSDDLTGGPSYYSRSSFTFGGAMATKLFANIWSETGLSFYQKGYQITSAATPDFSSNAKFRLNYLTLNQNILVKVAGKRNLSFSTGVGFFASALLGGRYNTQLNTILGYRDEEGSISIGNDSWDDFRAFDAGMNVLVRSQYRKIQLTVQFSPSFTNHRPAEYSNDGYKERLRSLAFTLGYEF